MCYAAHMSEHATAGLFAVIAVTVFLGLFSWLEGSQALEPSECGAIRPFLIDCKSCSKTVTKQLVARSDRGNIISELTRCRRCVVEMREDLACQPVAVPQPAP